MKARTKFLKLYYKMPKDCRLSVWRPNHHNMTFNVIAVEVRNKTRLGDKLLKEMGFDDT